MFGGNETCYAKRDVVSFSISQVNGRESINVECFVVPEIANIMNEFIEIVKHDYPHLKKIIFFRCGKEQGRAESGHFSGGKFYMVVSKG